MICCPFFEKTNHQLRTEPRTSILSTNITNNIFSCGRKSMFTNITSTRTCIIIAELNPGKHRIWVNTSFSHFFLNFGRCSPAELEGRTPQHKNPILWASLLNLEVFSWQGITANILCWKIPRTVPSGRWLTDSFGLSLFSNLDPFQIQKISIRRKTMH